MKNIKTLIAFLIKCVLALITTLILGILIVSADMAEHPDLSGYDQQETTIEIATAMLDKLF